MINAAAFQSPQAMRTLSMAGPSGFAGALPSYVTDAMQIEDEEELRSQRMNDILQALAGQQAGGGGGNAMSNSVWGGIGNKLGTAFASMKANPGGLI